MEIDQLKGLGPKSQQMLKQVGITDAQQFLAGEPFELYRLLKQQIPGVSLNMLYAILGAQENVPWQEIKKNRRTEILLRLDDMRLAPK